MSFLTDVEDAVLAEALDKLGTDSETYPTPEYLWLVYAGRDEVVPDITLKESKRPGLVMQYVSGQVEETGIGYQVDRELWNIAVVFDATADAFEYEGSDKDAFNKLVLSAADTMARRLQRILSVFRPSVTDDTFALASGVGTVPRWTSMLHWIGDYHCKVDVLMEYSLPVERGLT